MSPKNQISIILPNYNSSKYLSSTLKSILKQTYKNWKLFIVDDGSDKETLNILKKIKSNKKIKVIYLKKNRGAGYCRNLALKKVNSDFVAFIDSDDLWSKNKLGAQLKFMLKNNYKFSYTKYQSFVEGDNKLRKINIPLKFNFEEFTKNTSIATSTMMINRKIAKSVKFTETKICEDYFYKCMILKKTNYAYCLKNYLTKYRIRKNSLQSNKFKNFYWIWKINSKYNKFNFLKNFISLLSISFSSIKRYGYK